MNGYQGRARQKAEESKIALEIYKTKKLSTKDKLKLWTERTGLAQATFYKALQRTSTVVNLQENSERTTTMSEPDHLFSSMQDLEAHYRTGIDYLRRTPIPTFAEQDTERMKQILAASIACIDPKTTSPEDQRNGIGLLKGIILLAYNLGRERGKEDKAAVQEEEDPEFTIGEKVYFLDGDEQEKILAVVVGIEHDGMNTNIELEIEGHDGKPERLEVDSSSVVKRKKGS